MFKQRFVLYPVFNPFITTCASLLRDVTSRFVLFFFTKVVNMSGEAPQSLQWFQASLQNPSHLFAIPKSSLEAVASRSCCEINTHPLPRSSLCNHVETLCIYIMSSEIMEDRMEAVLMNRTGPGFGATSFLSVCQK